MSFLAGQPGVSPGKIALLGESMGGEQALVAAASEPRVRAVVAEGTTGQQVADHGWLPNGVDGALTRGMEWVQYTVAGLISGPPRPMSIPDAIRAAAPSPVLIIAGGAVPDEPIAARWFQNASPPPCGCRARGLGSSRDRLPERRAGPRLIAEARPLPPYRHRG